ncbi:MAG: M23 family metallopeptidase [Deltaproteobacteria bacterium]|nr:M23 family metallopeptidase [Deltaproteobacteria bacterium]
MFRKKSVSGGGFGFKGGVFVFLLLAVCGAGIWAYLFFFESRLPSVELSPEQAAVNSKIQFTLTARDEGRGLRDVLVLVRKGDKEFEVLSETFAEPLESWSGNFTVSAKGLTDGEIELEVAVRDRSLAHWGDGNRAMIRRSLVLDNKPPSVAVLTHQHYVNQGGCGLVIFKPGEAVVRAGVEIGKWFFPGYTDQDGDVFCYFAFPYDADPKVDQPRILLEDQAGNVQKSGFSCHVRAKKFPRDQINIDDSFLTAVMPQFRHLFPETENELELFLKVNRELRPQNRAMLVAMGQNTSSTPLWSGAFVRQPRAATRATFGDHRTYFYNKDRIDEQTHLGVDLASTLRAEVPASNDGRVIFADFLGIWGNVVIIDHGLGLQTLYAHLSQMDVAPGQDVAKGQTIGRTGTSGLAGGDHLHFGVVLSGLPVNPVEWWDPLWLRDNIELKLEQAGKVQG